MRISVVGESNFCEVFSFLGIEGIVVQDAEALIDVVKEKLEEKDTLLLISDSLYSLAPKQIEEMKSRSRGSIVIEIPSPYHREGEKFDLRKVLFSISGVKF